MLQARGGRFATTQWSLVRKASQRDSAEAAEALARLCSMYWYPIFAFIRRRGHQPAEAEDLTQSFFTRIIEKQDLAAADRDRGRFRTFLLSACEHFLLNERDRAVALKRGGGRAAIPIEIAEAEARYQRSLGHDETPERLYHRQWCLALLDAVLASLRDEYAAGGREAVFDRLRGFVTGETLGEGYDQAAADLGMDAGAVKVAVHRLRRRYRDAWRRRVGETVESPGTVDDEVREMLKVLGRV